MDGHCRRRATTTRPQPVKIYLNKKSLPKQNTIQNFNIDAKGLRETRNENPPTWKIGVSANLPTICRSAVTG